MRFNTADTPLRMMMDASATTIFNDWLLVLIFQSPFHLRHGGHKHVVLHLAVRRQVLLTIEDIEQDGVQQVVVLLFGVILDDDVLQFRQLAVYLVVVAGEGGDVYSMWRRTSLAYSSKNFRMRKATSLVPEQSMASMSLRRMAGRLKSRKYVCACFR